MEKPALYLILADALTRTALATALGAHLPMPVITTAPEDEQGLLLTEDGTAVDFPEDSIIRLPPGPVRAGRVLDLIAARIGRTGRPVVAFGPYTLSPDETELLQAGEAVRLTEKEVLLLQRLHGSDGAPVERAALLADIWGYGEGIDTHTLETHIYRLRRKIEDDPAAPRWLLTDGTRYRLQL